MAVSFPPVHAVSIRVVLLLPAISFAAEPAKPSVLDGIVAQKLPFGVRPPKGTPNEVLAVLGQRGDKIDCMSLRADGKLLALSGPDQVVRLWDLEKMRLLSTMKQPNAVICLAFAPDGKSLALGDSSGNIRLLKCDSGTLSLKLALVAHKDMPIWELAFTPDGNRLYAAARDKVASVWDISKAKPVQSASLKGHETQVRNLSLAAAGKLLATVGDQDQQLRLWDVAALPPTSTVAMKMNDRVVSVALAPEGKYVAVGGGKGVPALYAWDGKELTKAAALETDGRAATSIDFAADGERIVGISAFSPTEDRVLVWDLKGAILHEFKYERHLQAVAFAPDGRHLVVLTESEPLLVRLPKE